MIIEQKIILFLIITNNGQLIIYLKNLNIISSKFIDDFVNLYDENIKNNKYNINFNIAAKWLNLRTDSLKRTLINSYILNIDYKISINKLITAGRPRETIFLTTDCFKNICMLSKTLNSKDVRTNFIQIEKHIYKYKNDIINELKSHIEVLENKQ